MGLKLYCNRYAHFKDALVCSVNCLYRTRCQDFALFYDEHREAVDTLVGDYYAGRRANERSVPAAVATSRSLPVVAVARPIATAVDMRELIRLEVKQEMAEATYIWIDKDGRAELLGQDEVLRRAARGTKPQTIYKVAQEMELKFQLVPRKRIEKARRLAEVEEERAVARRTRRTTARPAAPQAFDELDAATPATPIAAAAAPRRTRRRTLKAVS
ncbi:MAG: hypothetical protein QOD32_2220 [Pyrinomonadaceae bacterium]|jgi:hypothetical protein|nr:hypothetical protein [Pyrinomonadaceae bacterium]